jgi:hypothetical protein
MRGYPELSEHELRSTLCRIAAEHQPDRAAMLHRIDRHRVGAPVVERRPAGPALRLAGSALAVAVILGVGGVARWALADGPDPGVVPVAPPTATQPTPAPSTPAAARPQPRNGR